MTQRSIFTLTLVQAYSKQFMSALWRSSWRNAALRLFVKKAIPIVYGGVHFGAGFRCDLLVGDKVIVEVKSIEGIHPVHKKQVLTYLRFADKRLGLLINFNVALIKDGITRLVNRLDE